jgi:hypothetical protein
VNSMRALNTSLSFNRAVTQLGVLNSCPGHADSTARFAPYIVGTECALAIQDKSACASASATVTRRCCCRLDGCKSNTNYPWAGSGIAVSSPLIYLPFDS